MNNLKQFHVLIHSKRYNCADFINVYLIDAVTGHIPFHCHHKRARGPTHVVHSENWIVVRFYALLAWLSYIDRLGMGLCSVGEGGGGRLC